MNLLTLGYIALGLNLLGLALNAGMFAATKKRFYLMFIGLALIGCYCSALGIHTLTKA